MHSALYFDGLFNFKFRLGVQNPSAPAVCHFASTLGKHTRDSVTLQLDSKGEGSLWFPKTLRIDDPKGVSCDGQSVLVVGTMAIDARSVNYDSPFVFQMFIEEQFHFQAGEIKVISGIPKQCQAGFMLESAGIFDHRGNNIHDDVQKAWPELIICGGLLPLFLWIGHNVISTVIGKSAKVYLEKTVSEKDQLRAIAVMTIIVAVAKTIGAIQNLIVFPILPFVILAIFYMYWFGAALYLFSADEIRQNDCNGSCCAYDLVSGKVKCDGCCGTAWPPWHLALDAAIIESIHYILEIVIQESKAGGKAAKQFLEDVQLTFAQVLQATFSKDIRGSQSGSTLESLNLDATLNALVSAGLGAAGQQYLALNTAVLVRGSKPLEEGLKEHARG
eukprot:Gb_23526 [translate_table: standard]